MKIKEQEKENGITIIALVVTIVVLIILAGISISTLMGENGIIEYAKRAAKETEESAKREKNDLEELESELTGKKYGVEANIQLSGEKLQVETPVLQAQIKHVSYSNTEIDIAKCAWALTSDSKPLGEEKEKYANSFKENEEEISFELPQVGDYYLHVLTVDNQEHIKETISGKISVSENYHKHEGNSITGGGCYTQPVYHAHAGDATKGDGCYTKPVYHTHTGNATTGTGCYTKPTYHMHTDSCKGEVEKQGECIVTVIDEKSGSGSNGSKYHCTVSQGSSGVRWTEWKIEHSSCGQGQQSGYYFSCVDHPEKGIMGGSKPPSSHTYTYTAIDNVCGKDTSTIEGYSIGCGKTEGKTIDGYSLNCGKDGTTIEYYNLSCDKNETSIECYIINY